MRSEFEKYFKENHADSFYSVDAALEMRGDDYIDFHAADLWALWQHQQSKVDELQEKIYVSEKTRSTLYEENVDLRDKNAELQKRMDAVKTLIEEYKDPPTKDKAFRYTLSIVAYELEQALKGAE